MKYMKLSFYFLLFFIGMPDLFSQTFSVNGIEYGVLDDKKLEVEACGIQYAKYWPSLDLPDYVEYNQQRYKVTSLDLFFFDTSFGSIRLPSFLKDLYISNCSIGEFEVSKNNPYFTSMDGVLFSKDMKELILYPSGRNNRSYEVPSTVTKINLAVFNDCKYLDSLTLPDGISCLDVSGMIYELDFPEIHISESNPNYTIEDGILFNKDQTRLIKYLPQRKSSSSAYVVPSSVKHVEENAFSMVYNLSKITLSDNLQTIGQWAFQNCTSLDSVFISSKVKLIKKEVFDGCTALKAIEVAPDNPYFASQDGILFDKQMKRLLKYPSGRNDSSYVFPSTVEEIADKAFSESRFLFSVEFSKRLRRIGDNAFLKSSLDSLSFPKSLRFVGDYAFKGCENIRTASIPGRVQFGVGVLQDCSSLKKATFSGKKERLEDNFFCGCSRLCDVILPRNLRHIGRGAFASCHDLYFIEIPQSVDSIGSLAFYHTSLEAVSFPKHLRYLGASAFGACELLTTVFLPGQVKLGVSVFEDCSSLQEVILPDDLERLDNSSFKNCRKLCSVKLPYKLRYIGNYAFDACNSLKSIALPESVDTIADGAFSSTSLKKIILPDNLRYLGAYTFRDCRLLSSISLPDKLEVLRIGTFDDCSSLHELTISARLKEIDSLFFMRCDSLKQINVDEGNPYFCLRDGVLFNKERKKLLWYPREKKDSLYVVPEGVEEIGEYAFFKCEYVKTLIFPKSLKRCAASAFKECLFKNIQTQSEFLIFFTE